MKLTTFIAIFLLFLVSFLQATYAAKTCGKYLSCFKRRTMKDDMQEDIGEDQENEIPIVAPVKVHVPSNEEIEYHSKRREEALNSFKDGELDGEDREILISKRLDAISHEKFLERRRNYDAIDAKAKKDKEIVTENN